MNFGPELKLGIKLLGGAVTLGVSYKFKPP